MERRTRVPARAAQRWRRPRMFAFRWSSLERTNAWTQFRPDRASANRARGDPGENYTAGALPGKDARRKPPAEVWGWLVALATGERVSSGAAGAPPPQHRPPPPRPARAGPRRTPRL